MQDIWKLEKHCIWSGIVYSDHNGITSGDSYIGSKRSKSDYLSVSRQFVLEKVQMASMGVLVPNLFH